MAKCDVQTLIANAACFQCLTPGMWDLLIIQLYCEILKKKQPNDELFRLTNAGNLRVTSDGKLRIKS